MWWLLHLLFCCVDAQLFYEIIQQQYAEREYTMQQPTLLKEYDFIVVGAGPAGCVIANRLTENPHWKVLLLEAGTTENGYSEIPALSTIFPPKQYQWNFKTEKSPNACLGLPDQSCSLPAGKAVGGGTVINAMMYTRGNRKDYDTWHKLGNDGWSYEEILPYFLKSEDIQIPELKSSPYHSNNGNLTVEETQFQIPLNQVFLKAGEEVALPYTDYNGAEPIGVSKIQTTKRKGRRVSAFKAFLEPIKARNNLHIRHSTTVTRILIDPATKTAYGVEFAGDHNTSRVFAKNEVILSAGAIMSPFLLMHSGIGHQDHLKDMGIPVIQNLPVGDNFQDHLVMIGLTFLINNFSLTVNYPKDVFPNLPKLVEEFEGSGNNVLSSTGVEILAFVKSLFNNSADGYPHLELLFPSIPTGSRSSAEVYSTVFEPIKDKPQLAIWPVLLNPKSRGNIRLKSSNSSEGPKITANYLTHDEDVEMMVEGIKWGIRLSQTEAFQKIGSRLHDTPVPGCESFTFASDSYWACLVRHLSTTIYHYSGTCRMGSTGDPVAVVDPRLRVQGVNRLRVADTSIIPKIPSGHTAAAAYMIGEKAADMIKKDWKYFKILGCYSVYFNDIFNRPT